MLGMNGTSFLVLAVIAVVVAGVMHYGLKLYIIDDVWSFLSKAVVAWIGAWLGSPVLGHWPAGLSIGSVYYIPATIGAVGAVIIAVDVAKTMGARRT